MEEVGVTVVSDEMKADVVCGMLKVNGIPSFARPALELGLLGAVGSAAAGVWRPFEIVVNTADAPRAKELLAAADD